MTRPAQLVLAAVALVAVAGLVVAQRLKGEPAYVRRVYVTPRFTPNGDTLRDRATIRFAVGRRDVVAVTLLDAGRPARAPPRPRAAAARPAAGCGCGGAGAPTPGRPRRRGPTRSGSRSGTAGGRSTCSSAPGCGASRPAAARSAAGERRA